MIDTKDYGKNVQEAYSKTLKDLEAFSEADKKFDVTNTIKGLVDTEWSKGEDKGKAASLFKGLIFSDDPKAKKFITALDKLTSDMKLDDYK